MNNEYNPIAEEKPLLLEEELYTYEYASTGQRFVNYLFDGILVNFAMCFAFFFILGFVFAATRSNPYDSPEESTGVLVLTWIIALFSYPLYSAICEKAFKGRTLGKLVSGTKAMRLDGGELTWKDAILRALCRLIPFEAFSALSGNPWHDSITNTTVVNMRR